jgi:hypothetical protein
VLGNYLWKDFAKETDTYFAQGLDATGIAARRPAVERYPRSTTRSAGEAHQLAGGQIDSYCYPGSSLEVDAG